MLQKSKSLSRKVRRPLIYWKLGLHIKWRKISKTLKVDHSFKKMMIINLIKEKKTLSLLCPLTRRREENLVLWILKWIGDLVIKIEVTSKRDHTSTEISLKIGEIMFTGGKKEDHLGQKKWKISDPLLIDQGVVVKEGLMTDRKIEIIKVSEALMKEERKNILNKIRRTNKVRISTVNCMEI